MIVETEAQVIQEPIIRHYRGATRTDVEQAYRSEAAQAAASGFLPIAHQWTTDYEGFLLAVTYRHSAGASHRATPADNAPLERSQAVTEVAPPAVVAEPTSIGMDDRFAPYHAAGAQDRLGHFAAREQEPPVASPIPQPPYQPPVYQPPVPMQQMTQPEPIYQAPAPMPQPEPVYQPPAPIPQPEPYQPPAPMQQMTQPERVYRPEPVYPPQPEPGYQPPAPMPQPEPVYRPEPVYPPQPMAQPEPVYQPPAPMPQPEPVYRPEPVYPPQPMAQPEPVYQPPAPQPMAQPEPVNQAHQAMVQRALPGLDSAPAPRSADWPIEPPTADRAWGQLASAPVVTPQIDIPNSQPAPVDLATPLAGPASEPEPETPAESTRRTRLTVQTMDMHTCGEPLRIVRSGFPDVPHLPVLERREWVRRNADHVRRSIIHEPRGHRDMYGAILLPPYSDYADMTVLFMHNEGYSTMCGHGIIAITTGLIEEGLFPATEPVTTIRYEVPAGIVAANAATVQLENGEWAVQGVRFTNVPSYVAAQSLSVRPDGVQLFGSAAQYGALSVDLAFGGAYYGIVNAAELGLRVVPDEADALRRAGAAITEVLRRDHTPAHPTDADLSFVYGTIIVDLDPRSSPDGKASRAHMRNATIFADAELDRSPCGSGTSAILAQLHARGRIRVGQEIINAGITGEHFLGRIEAETALGPYPAVSTSVAGTAYITGYSTFTVDSRDPLGDGFLLR